jgi:hypothetical protein
MKRFGFDYHKHEKMEMRSSHENSSGNHVISLVKKSRKLWI